MSSNPLNKEEDEIPEFIKKGLDNTWIRDLLEDPASRYPNRKGRSVTSGHYVRVKTTPIPDPKLVILSKEMSHSLGFTTKDTSSKEFLRFFSAHQTKSVSWATPYALSQGGHEVYRNCPYKNGTGYGDGRAASVGEIVAPDGQRWELQLKGAGPTPFCRGADGRAIFRSSIREFLASEAMFAMGVSTTRALSLIVSKTGTVRRPWYSDELRSHTSSGGIASLRRSPQIRSIANQLALRMGFGEPSDVLDAILALADKKSHPLLDAFPRGLHYQLKMITEQLIDSNPDPDVMRNEFVAITTRVAPSFLRIGHIEVHARRLNPSSPAASAWVLSESDARDSLERIVKHALVREFADVDDHKEPLSRRIVSMIRESGRRIAVMVANWLRVGYCQGNFNGDNCLIAGRTMDYGPFGFIERYERLWNMWSGGGPSYAFANQPKAAELNFGALVRALMPLLDDDPDAKSAAREAVDSFEARCADVVNDMWRKKMGLTKREIDSVELYERLDKLMEDSKADYTMFWRQLAEVVPRGDADADVDESALPKPLRNVFYAPLTDDTRGRWTNWLREWRDAIRKEGRDPSDVVASMKRTNPKFVPREFLLVDAYSRAERGDYSGVHELHELFKTPYAEGSAEQTRRFYRKSPSGSHLVGGTGFMT